MLLVEKGVRGKGRQPLSPPQRWRDPECEGAPNHQLFEDAADHRLFPTARRRSLKVESDIIVA